MRVAMPPNVSVVLSKWRRTYTWVRAAPSRCRELDLRRTMLTVQVSQHRESVMNARTTTARSVPRFVVHERTTAVVISCARRTPYQLPYLELPVTGIGHNP